jgi:hypothetical protein
MTKAARERKAGQLRVRNQLLRKKKGRDLPEHKVRAAWNLVRAVFRTRVRWGPMWRPSSRSTPKYG